MLVIFFSCFCVVGLQPYAFEALALKYRQYAVYAAAANWYHASQHILATDLATTPEGLLDLVLDGAVQAPDGSIDTSVWTRIHKEVATSTPWVRVSDLGLGVLILLEENMEKLPPLHFDSVVAQRRKALHEMSA